MLSDFHQPVDVAHDLEVEAPIVVHLGLARSGSSRRTFWRGARGGEGPRVGASPVCRRLLIGISRICLDDEAEIAEFSRRYAASRKPLLRFLAVAREAEWPHFPAFARTFPSADTAPATGTVIFDIGRNKYRLIARGDFEERALFIERVLTHEQYDRENL
jgi:mRNA interferase HigB